VEQIDALERPVRQALQHIERVTHMQPDVVEGAVGDFRKRADDAIQKRFAADEAMPGTLSCLSGEMLATAEADLQLERQIGAEQPLGRQRTFGDADPRQQIRK
jgi:hypothetical protein